MGPILQGKGPVERPRIQTGPLGVKIAREMQVENIEHKTSKVSGCNKNGRRVKQVVNIIVKYIKGVTMCVTIPRKIDQQGTVDVAWVWWVFR